MRGDGEAGLAVLERLRLVFAGREEDIDHRLAAAGQNHAARRIHLVENGKFRAVLLDDGVRYAARRAEPIRWSLTGVLFPMAVTGGSIFNDGSLETRARVARI